MDMSFANQALAAEHLVQAAGTLDARVHGVPPQIDDEVARLTLAARSVEIDGLTPAQKTYLTSWERGT